MREDDGTTSDSDESVEFSPALHTFLYSNESAVARIRDFDRLLPDGDCRPSRIFVDKMRTLATTLVDGEEGESRQLLPMFLHHLIRVREHGSEFYSSHWSVVNGAKEAAGEVLIDIMSRFGDFVAPLSLHLETLWMRLITASSCFGGAKWAAEYAPLLLGLLKIRGGEGAVRSFWLDYWRAIRTEIAEHTAGGNDLRLTAAFLSSIGACLRVLGTEGISEQQRDEIRAMVAEELAKSRSRRENNVYEYVDDRETEKDIVQNAAVLVTAANEVLGVAWVEVADPLLPALDALNDEEGPPSKKLRLTETEDIAAALPEASSSSSSHSDVSMNSSSQLEMALDSAAPEKSDLVPNRSPNSDLASELWKVYQDQDASAEDRVKAIHQLTEQLKYSNWEEILATWGPETLESFCARLVQSLQTESTEQLRDALIDLCSVVARNRIDTQGQGLLQGSAFIQRWEAIVAFIVNAAESDCLQTLLTALRLVERFPHVVGGELGPLRALFNRGMNLQDKNVLSATMKALKERLKTIRTEHYTCEKRLATLTALIPPLVKAIEDNGLCGDATMMALDCLADLCVMRLEHLRSHLDRLFTLCCEIFAVDGSEEKEDCSEGDDDSTRLRGSALDVLSAIGQGCWEGGRWGEVTSIIGEEAVTRLGQTLLAGARCKRNESLLSSTTELILGLARHRYEKSTEWAELIDYVHFCSNSDSLPLMNQCSR